MQSETTETSIDMSWAANAACKDADPNLFYSDYLSTDGRFMQNTAIQICNRCPARIPCLEYALIYERHGVWGGMNEHQRNVYRRNQNLNTRLDRFNVVSFLARKQQPANTLEPTYEMDSDELTSFSE